MHSYILYVFHRLKSRFRWCRWRASTSLNVSTGDENKNCNLNLLIFTFFDGKLIFPHIRLKSLIIARRWHLKIKAVRVVSSLGRIKRRLHCFS